MDEQIVVCSVPKSRNSANIEVRGTDVNELHKLHQYAWHGADFGTQDSELIAESIRHVALYGYGDNRIADAIAKEFLG